MPVKIYKKTSPGRRQMSVNRMDKKFSHSERSLTASLKKRGGRSRGKISVRHQGGGHKRKFRIIDFKMDKFGIPAVVARIERDPNRSARIALLNYADGEKRYVVAVKGMKEGVKVISAEKTGLRAGNRMQLRNIPVGTAVCLAELFPGKGAQIARSAGSSVTFMSADGENAQLKLASGEMRQVSSKCYATIGEVGNALHSTVMIGKAGRSRWLGIRPTVRGTAMNPVDHPHGGGEGRQPIGLKHPKTPWGKPALGKRTRKKYKYSNKFIIKRRSK